MAIIGLVASQCRFTACFLTHDARSCITLHHSHTTMKLQPTAIAQVAVAARSASGSTAWAVTLEKGARTRAAEDALASRLLLALLAQSAGVQLHSELTADLLGSNEAIQVRSCMP